MERAARIPMTLAAVVLAAVALQARSTASAADTDRVVLSRPGKAAEPEAARATGRPLIERAPGVGPTTAPLEFGFAVVDWLLGG